MLYTRVYFHGFTGVRISMLGGNQIGKARKKKTYLLPGNQDLVIKATTMVFYFWSVLIRPL